MPGKPGPKPAGTTRPDGSHLEAIEAAVAERRDALTAADEPLIRLAKQLAHEMDIAGAETGSRLYSAYLTSVRELSRRLLSVQPSPSSGKLDELRAQAARRTRPAPSRKTSKGRDAS